MRAKKKIKKPTPIERAANEMALLLNQWSDYSIDQRRSKLKKFARRGKWHRKVLLIMLKKARDQQVIRRGFHEGSRTPSSDLRKIDKNKMRK